MSKSCKKKLEEELEEFCNNGCIETNETLPIIVLQQLAVECANVTAILAEINHNRPVPSNNPGFGPEHPNSTTGGGAAPNGGGKGPGNGVVPSPNNIAFSGQCGPMDPNTAGNPYCCGVPGAVEPSLTGSNIGACSWDFEAALTTVYSGDPTEAKAQLRWVKLQGTPDTPTNLDCPVGNECTGLEVCGTIFRPFKATPNDFTPHKCGIQLGYWSANEICATTITSSNPFLSCSPTHNDLYKCVGTAAQSCYSPDAISSCCGCADWKQDFNIPVATGVDGYGNLFTKPCVAKNSAWTTPTPILNSVKWLKSACPSAYSYPFDDMSSTFKCYQDAEPNGSNNNNAVNYMITSCPAIGMPANSANTAPEPIENVRIFKFYNNCDFSVWPAMVGGTGKHRGFSPASSNPDDTCASDAACFPGATCMAPLFGDGVKRCFWTNPPPEGGISNYEVASGESVEFHIPMFPGDTHGIIWSGAIAARAGCPTNPQDGLCDIADCRGFTPTGNFSCIQGQGFVQPATQAEITVQIHDADYYDVEIINGASISLQMDPCVGVGHCFVE